MPLQINFKFLPPFHPKSSPLDFAAVCELVSGKLRLHTLEKLHDIRNQINKEWREEMSYFEAYSAIFATKKDLLRKKTTGGCGEPPVLAPSFLSLEMAV